MENVVIQLECLKLAVSRARDNATTEDVIDEASKFIRLLVLHQTQPPNDIDDKDLDNKSDQ